MTPGLHDALRRWALRRCGLTVEVAAPLERAGDDPGCWTLCPFGLGAHSVVYSVGVGRHIGFDLWVIRRFGATLHAFDPTPVSIEWIGRQSLPPQFRFHPLGLAAIDGDQVFYAPRSPSSAHFTSIPRCATAPPPALTAPVRRLSTLARELGHDHVDLLKMDIEGGEYEVIADMARNGPHPGQLLVEFHHNYPSVPLSRTELAVQQPRACGYRIAHISPRGLEFYFVQSEALPS